MLSPVLLQIVRQEVFVTIQQFSVFICGNILNLAFSSARGSEVHDKDFLLKIEQRSYVLSSANVA